MIKKQAGKKKRHNFISYASRDVVWIAQVLVIPDEGNVLSTNYITAALCCCTGHSVSYSVDNSGTADVHYKD